MVTGAGINITIHSRNIEELMNKYSFEMKETNIVFGWEFAVVG